MLSEYELEVVLYEVVHSNPFTGERPVTASRYGGAWGKWMGIQSQTMKNTYYIGERPAVFRTVVDVEKLGFFTPGNTVPNVDVLRSKCTLKGRPIRVVDSMAFDDMVKDLNDPQHYPDRRTYLFSLPPSVYYPADTVSSTQSRQRDNFRMSQHDFRP